MTFELVGLGVARDMRSCPGHALAMPSAVVTMYWCLRAIATVGLFLAQPEVMQ